MKCRASGDIFQTIYIAVTVSMMYLGGAPLAAQCSPAHARPRRRLKGPPPPGGPATLRPGGSGPGSPGQHTRLPLAVGSQAPNGETPGCTRTGPDAKTRIFQADSAMFPLSSFHTGARYSKKLRPEKGRRKTFHSSETCKFLSFSVFSAGFAGSLGPSFSFPFGFPLFYSFLFGFPFLFPVAYHTAFFFNY